MIAYIFRKRVPTGFSIEKLFDALYDHLRRQGAQLERVELPHVASGIGGVLKNAWYVCRTVSAPIVHITGDAHYAALLRPFRKTVITIHDCVILQRGTGFKRFVFWLLWYRLPLAFASAVTVISEQTKREVLRTVALPEGKIRIIGNFVRPEFVLSKRDFNHARPRILHVGTGSNKNLPRVIAALRDIPSVLAIVGKLDAALVEQLTEFGIDYENHLSVDNATMARLYRDADIVSFPSTYEGFGMPILEGQAVGRAVLTSDAEPMRSVAGKDGALLVDAHSVGAIRAGFQALIADAALRERLIAAGVENCKQYSIENVAMRYQALYESLSRQHHVR